MPLQKTWYRSFLSDGEILTKADGKPRHELQCLRDENKRLKALLIILEKLIYG